MSLKLETEHLSSSCLCSGIAPVLAYAFAYNNAHSIVYNGSTKCIIYSVQTIIAWMMTTSESVINSINQ